MTKNDQEYKWNTWASVKAGGDASRSTLLRIKTGLPTHGQVRGPIHVV